MRLKFFPALRAVISLFLIGLLIFIRRDSLDQTISAIRGAHFPVVAGAIALFFTTIFTLAYRLKTVLKAKKIRLKFLEVVKLTFTGFFFNNFLPTAVGGDVVKGYYLYKNTGDKLNSFISIVMDRFIGFFTLFLMASVSLIFSHSYVQNKTLIFFTVGILLLLTIMLVVLFNKKAARAFRFFSPLAERMGIKEKIERSYNTINDLKSNKGLIAQALPVSITAQAIAFVVVYLLTRALGSYISIKMVFLFMPLVFIIALLPSINGLGVREWAIYYLFGPYVGRKEALALGLLWLFMLFLVSITGGIIYLLQGGKMNQEVLNA